MPSISNDSIGLNIFSTSDSSGFLFNTTSSTQQNITECFNCETFAPEHFLDQIYLLTFGIMIVFMDLGFGLVEAGSVRSKNTTHILIKNILDSFTACIAYWLIGYALAFGKGNEFIGWHNWAMHDLHDSKISFLFYQVMFASTATTIVAGAVSERCEFIAYLIYSFFLTAFIYPVVTHWGWTTQGWLYQGYDFEINGQMETIRYEDYGGSGLVHLVGGTSAFFATFFLGPRLGRFHKESGTVINIRGHSVAMATMGIFVLLFGFMAFNAASQLHITQSGDSTVISLAVFNTLISASVGGVSSLITHRIGLFGDTWNILAVINGAFVGMVSICGGCNAMRPWGAAIVGFIAAFIMKTLEKVLTRFEIDDPLNAVGIHFGGGVWGTVSVAIFKYDDGILMAWSQRSAAFLAWQLVAVSSIILWTGGLAFILFGTLKFLRIFRVSEDIEKKGLDIARHNQPAYPLEAYGHGHIEEIKRVTSDGKLATYELDFKKHLGLPSYFSHHESPDFKVTGIHRSVSSNDGNGKHNEVLATLGTLASNKLVKMKQLLHLSPRQETKTASINAGEIFKIPISRVDITKL